MAEKRYLLALDAGGTMTDTFLTDEEGRFYVGKALTDHREEFRSYLASVSDAAHFAEGLSADIHTGAVGSVYAGTSMLNLLLTQGGLRVGLLATKGFEGSPFMERGLTWLGKSYEDQMHMALHEHPARLTRRPWVKAVAERIKGPTWYTGCHVPADTVVVPLREEDVEKGAHELLDEGVEVIGIWFLHSYANPMHELRAAEIARKIVRERGLDVSVVTSHELCPLSNENERLKTLLVYCYCTVPARQQLEAVEKAAREDGLRYGLETFLSYGATASISYPRLHEAIVSGPTGGLIGAYGLLKELKGIENIICCDLGGTSFDVGIIAKGQMPLDSEPEFAGHKLRMPMLSIDSIGAGAGTVIRVDPALKKISLGPESAGSEIGTCYRYPEITVADVDVVLGYLDPNYFLGGSVKLDKGAAFRALEKQLAEPLGMGVHEASVRVLELLHSQLREHVAGCVLSIGHRSEDYTLVAYGGSGPLHLWGLEGRSPFGAMCTCPWAAAFSAFGIAMADYFYRYDKSVVSTLPTAVPDEVKLALAQDLNGAWQELEERAVKELGEMGYARETIRFRYKAQGRYLGQMFSWEFPLEKGRVETVEDVRGLIEGFEKVYLSIYPSGARFPEAGYAITGVICEAVVPRAKPVVAVHPLGGLEPSRRAHKGQRDVYHVGEWTKFDIWEMDLLEAGNRVTGPAIIEHPMTTLVVPPKRYIDIDEHHIVWYRANSA